MPCRRCLREVVAVTRDNVLGAAAADYLSPELGVR